MINLTCKRCGSKFFTAAPDSVKRCPYCSFVFSSKDPVRRQAEREEIRKDCVLEKGSVRLDVSAVDISPKGVGIKLKGSIYLGINDAVHVTIKDFDIDSSAKVVWIKTVNDEYARVGLSFN